MPDSAQQTWRGRRVEFLIRDIHLPQPAEVLLELHGDDSLAGEVIDLSDGAQGGGAFVVVRCERLRRPCVLAVERIQEVGE
jgi:hypothetical protein